MSHEIKNFGVRVLIVEPGIFRTQFSSRLVMPAAHEPSGYSDAYEDTELGDMVRLSKGLSGTSTSRIVWGDPDIAAKHIVQAVTGGHSFLRLILGSDCVLAMERRLQEWHHDLDATRHVATSTDTESA